MSAAVSQAYMKQDSKKIYAPGQRVIIRDAEWIIRRVDPISGGSYKLVCTGVSNFIKGKEAIFLTCYDQDVQIVDPTETRLVIDKSPNYDRSFLYLESLMRELVPVDDKIYRGHRAAIDQVPYQFDPALQALKQPRHRILMGDAVGLGKTIEAGVLVSELLKRGKAKRILVLAVKSMLTQFQKEFWNRFSIPLTRLDSQGIQRVRNRIPTNMNPFLYYDKSIISIDTLKQQALYRTHVENAYWDVIIIDEAHNVADRNSGSLKSKLAKLVASRCDSLIMLSATPHDGSAKSFASLLNLLDPTAIANVNDYSKQDFQDKGLVIRRFKKDIQNQVEKEFKDRKIFMEEGKVQANEAEEAAFAFLGNLEFKTIDARKRRGSELFKTTLIKSLMSSPLACLSSIEERLKKLEAGENNDQDIENLKALKGLLEKIPVSRFSKYQHLVNLIKKEIRWSKSHKNDRLVIFTERIATLKFLEENLTRDLKLNDNELVTMTGSMPDSEINQIVEDFGQLEAKPRILVATDVASEGINLHYQSHRLFHFDIPWSLMVFQQRNGRIDRYGQEQQPEIYYMQTESSDKTFKGDNRILDILKNKDEQANRNIGDPSAFMNVYDISKEEEITARAMEEGKFAEEFDQELNQNVEEAEFDFLSFLKDTQENSAELHPADVYKEMPSIFRSDLDFAAKALNYMKQKFILKTELRIENDRISLSAPEDLKYRFKMLPGEIWPEDGYFILSPEQELINKEIANARRSEDAWPKIHYLWEQHPLMEWLRDKLLTNFKRLEAPAIKLSSLRQNEVIFLVSGLLPNRKAQPVIHNWYGIKFADLQFVEILNLSEVFSQTGIGEKLFANSATEYDLSDVQSLLPAAVEKAKEKILTERKSFEEQSNEKLQVHIDHLDELKARHQQQLDLDFSETEKERAKKQEREREINRIFDDYLKWIEDSMIIEKEPYMQVMAALTGGRS
jgi:superfamily II DNA or RNA helicase